MIIGKFLKYQADETMRLKLCEFVGCLRQHSLKLNWIRIFLHLKNFCDIYVEYPRLPTHTHTRTHPPTHPPTHTHTHIHAHADKLHLAMNIIVIKKI